MKRQSIAGFQPVADIFGASQEVVTPPVVSTTEALLTELHRYEKNPYRVVDDASMYGLAESISEQGVLVPAIVRPNPSGGYQVLSGQRRQRACEIAGVDRMPIIVRDVDDHMAALLIVYCNIQREKVLFSEKAFAYLMALDALKHQGLRSDLSCGQVGHKILRDTCGQVVHMLPGEKSIDIVAKQAKEHRKQVQRYIRLTNLTKRLLDWVDEEKMSFTVGVEVSYLMPQDQDFLYEILMDRNIKLSLAQAVALRETSQSQELGEGGILSIVVQEQKRAARKHIPVSKFAGYFPEGYTTEQIEETLIQLLEAWSVSKAS